MTRRTRVLTVLLAVGLGGVAFGRGDISAQQASSQQNHVAWVAETLKRMQTVKVGMTREDLLRVFTTEGGQSTGLQRTFVSRDCPYFKVDVTFHAVGRPDKDNDGRVTLVEGSQDIIVGMSRPYLQFMVLD